MSLGLQLLNSPGIRLPLLDPHRVWARWKFVRPGEPSGMAYDGLVWVDDHWAWFPKPYRVLAHLVPANEAG